MDIDLFLNACELIKNNLVNLTMDRTFNSIGSNVFFEFGNEQEFLSRNGKKNKKEWSIWISHAAWRITKKGAYIVGSIDDQQVIQSKIIKLLGKRFQSFQFLSQFLDVEFSFEGEYKLTTFFNWREENQWTVFLPDQTNIEIDCLNPEEIINVQNIATHFSIIEKNEEIKLSKKNMVVKEISCNDFCLPTLHFNDNTSLKLENCIWRLEKDNDYILGYGDYYLANTLNHPNTNNKYIIPELIGQQLKRIDVANSMNDARFEFENQYVLKTFSCSSAIDQWKILSNGFPIYNANINLIEDRV